MAPPVLSGPRYNQFINVPKVRVIDENGENLGVMYTREAIEQAAGVGLDLVEISPGADPPVAKFLDIGRFKYERKKATSSASARREEIKEIKMRPNIDDHDYQTKMKKSSSSRGRRQVNSPALPRSRNGAQQLGMPCSARGEDHRRKGEVEHIRHEAGRC